jgi:hypothetical protein
VKAVFKGLLSSKIENLGKFWTKPGITETKFEFQNLKIKENWKVDKETDSRIEI